MTASDGKTAWTVLELLNWTTDYFRHAGIADARLNAEALLAGVLGMERIMLYARFDEPVGEDERARFRKLVKERAARVPLQYLTGECEFYGRSFEVTPAVMVPRQETELVVEQCLEVLAPQAEAWAADLCAGSGAIAVSLAAERPLLRLVAADASAEALHVAARNAERHGVAERVLTAAGDLAAPVARALPQGRERVELVAANPPYVPTDRIAQLQPEVRDHEPRAALDGGPDGLDVVRRLVPQAADLLAPGGHLVMEIGEGQAGPAREMMAGTGAFAPESLATFTDASGCERVVRGRRAGS